MRTFRARGPQCVVSARRCHALRSLAGSLRPSYSRAESAAVRASADTVPVTISIKCKVEFGESLRLVGNQPFLGGWDPSKGAEMSWNDGNVWKTDTLVPVGADVDFKVVKAKHESGVVTWEEGGNRSFKILGPDFGLRLTCHWGRPQDMKIDVYKLQSQQHQEGKGVAVAAAAGSNNGATNGVTSASGNGVGAAPRDVSQASRNGSSAASISVDSGSGGDSGSSNNNGTGRSPSASLVMSRSSLEEESAVRTAWVGAEPEFVRSRRKDEQARGGVWRTEGLSGVVLDLVRGDETASSWLKKLGLQKQLLVDEAPACRPGLDAMSNLYVYATWVNTGALPCAESGSHYRPNHHANLALAMFRSLEWVIGDATRGSGARSPAAERLILAARRMHSRLPSFSGQFRASTPLTRIRDIAHRNDIPKELKDEIKHTLQNKLHRCAGPEDLVATEAMLQRVTAVPGQYSESFVEEFRVFTEELREFFNASGLVELLTAGRGLEALDDAHASAVRQLITTKQRVENLGAAARLDDLMALLTAATQARSFYAAGLVAGLRNDVTDEILSTRQRWRLADIRLEEYSFVVLSRIIGLLEDQGAPAKLPRASNLQWALPLAALTSGLRHMGLSLYDTRELLVLENELQRWHSTCPLVETRDAALRAKASLERALRVATEYSDMVAEVYGSTAATLGRALGLPEHMGGVFAEAEVRASMAFQVSKLAAMLARALRTAAGQEPWDVLVPGEVTGVLREVPQLDGAALEGPSAGGGSGKGGKEEEGVVLVVRRAEGDEELGPLGPRLRGVMLLQELPHLSHLGVRARQDRVTFVTCDDEDTVSRVLRPLIGRHVTLSAAGDGTVTVREATAPRTKAAGPPLAAAAPPPPREAEAAAVAADAAPDAAAAKAVADAAKEGRWADVVVPLERAVAAICGSKSAKCAALAVLAAKSGVFSAPRGAVVPFGALEAAVAAAGRGKEFEALLGRLDDPGVAGVELEAVCGQIRALVSELEVPAGLVQQVVKAITSCAGASDGQPPLLLALRSSANVEDLAGMSAAGLYDSVVGVPADNAAAVGEAVGEVWASLYTRRAVLSRRAAGVSQSSARMAVLAMEMVAPDLSFVLHTARPRDGNSEVLLAEVAPGQGETLASGTRGTPWRFEVAKSSGTVTTLAFANFSTALVLPGKGKPVATFASYGSGAATAAAASTSAGTRRRSSALVEREVDYGAQRMSADGDWRKATVRQMADVGSYIEEAMGGVPQDIEGGVVMRPDGGVSLHIFQTRPQ